MNYIGIYSMAEFWAILEDPALSGWLGYRF
jgi:hypothetical protein